MNKNLTLKIIKSQQKIIILDIVTLWGGFSVEKITSATDTQLTKLEEQLTLKVDSVKFANIEEFGFLNVAWLNKNTTGLKDKQTIIKILNEIFDIK